MQIDLYIYIYRHMYVYKCMYIYIYIYGSYANRRYLLSLYIYKNICRHLAGKSGKLYESISETDWLYIGF